MRVGREKIFVAIIVKMDKPVTPAAPANCLRAELARVSGVLKAAFAHITKQRKRVAG